MLDNLRKKMDSNFESLIKGFSGLRAGRASVGILDTIMVDAYGSMVPIQQVGSVSAPDAKTITIQIWDTNLIKPLEVAIRNSQIGLSPVLDGQLMRLIVPDLSEERRKEICKMASKMAEQHRVAIRNIRRDGLDEIKKQEKSKEISEDDLKKTSDSIQKLTDEFIKKIDNVLSVKEKDIMSV